MFFCIFMNPDFFLHVDNFFDKENPLEAKASSYFHARIDTIFGHLAITNQNT